MNGRFTGRKIQFFIALNLAAMALPLVTAAGSQETKPVARLVTVSVDPRVELISIIFRLAGNFEYNKGKLVSYVNAVEKQFGSYREHPVVRLAADLREKYSVSFDAPMSRRFI